MKPTLYSSQRSGLLADSDLVRPRPGSRRDRPVYPTERLIEIEVGDVRDAVDSGWRAWAQRPARAA